MAVYKLQIVDEEGNVVQQDDITPMEQVNVEVSQTTGEASGSASYGDGVLDIHLQGIKGEKGEKGDSIQGEQGVQGDSAVFDPSTGNISTIRQTMGTDSNSPMSQKAVTDNVKSQSQIIGETEEIASTIKVTWEQGSISSSGEDFSANSTIRTTFFSAADDHIAISCAEGYYIKMIMAYNSESKTDASGWVYYGNKGSGFDTSVNQFDFWGNNKFFRIGIGRVDGTNITPSEGSNASLVSVETIANGLGRKVTFDEVANYVAIKALPQTDDFYGSVTVARGTIVTSQAHTVYTRIFEIEDANKIYFADLRTYPASSGSYCGVAYFDEDDGYICGQYISGEEAKVWKMARLSVPNKTKYIYILGTDMEASTVVMPQLYVAGDIKDSVDCGLRPIVNFAFVGKGEASMANSAEIPVTGNMHLMVKFEYSEWTNVNPTSTAWAIYTREYITGSSSPIANVSWTLNNFTPITGYEFVTRDNAQKFSIGIRAGAGEVIHCSIYEVVEGECLAKADPPKNKIIYNVESVNLLPLKNIEGVSSAVLGSKTDSAWAVMFPNSYTIDGKPTQVIAMLHGANGYVTPTVMGYDVEKWINWRNRYLSEGFAVLEINGWGISEESDAKSTHWGCPAAQETLDKAFESLKANYNVCDKIMLHGTSMGGAASWAYALTHPNKVLAIGLFSPAALSWLFKYENGLVTFLTSWQYADINEAIAEDYQRIVGHDPILASSRYKDGLLTPIETLYMHDVVATYGDSDEYVLVGQSLDFPVRIWHGTADPTVPIALSQAIVAAYRRGGQMVTLRSCPGLDHAICTGGTQYVIDEAIEYFKRYAE